MSGTPRAALRELFVPATLPGRTVALNRPPRFEPSAARPGNGLPNRRTCGADRPTTHYVFEGPEAARPTSTMQEYGNTYSRIIPNGRGVRERVANLEEGALGRVAFAAEAPRRGRPRILQRWLQAGLPRRLVHTLYGGT